MFPKHECVSEIIIIYLKSTEDHEPAQVPRSPSLFSISFHDHEMSDVDLDEIDVVCN